MMSTDADKWFYRPAATPAAAMRLFCFHYVGGSAQIFRKWGPALQSVCEVVAVQMPGRGSRIGEKLYTRIEDLTRDLYSAMVPLLDKPYALYGHSLGAMVAFEMAKKMAIEKAKAPAALYLASRVAASVPPVKPHLTGAPDDAFIAGMTARYGGNAGMALMDDPEIRALFLPTLRADMELHENYIYTGPDQLTSPFFTLLGKTDLAVKPEDMSGWSKFAAGKYEFHQFQGGHFFWQENDAELMAFLKESLTKI